MTVLQKGFSHRKGAKDAKVFKDEVQDFKSCSNLFAFPAHMIDFLRALGVFAVKDLFFQWAHELTRILKIICDAVPSSGSLWYPWLKILSQEI